MGSPSDLIESINGKFLESARPEKLYIVIGFGGSPKSPERIFCVPLDEAQYIGFGLDKIKRFEHVRGDHSIVSTGRAEKTDRCSAMGQNIKWPLTQEKGSISFSGSFQIGYPSPNRAVVEGQETTIVGR